LDYEIDKRIAEDDEVEGEEEEYILGLKVERSQPVHSACPENGSRLIIRSLLLPVQALKVDPF
jgi:hypothetical protein